VVLLLASEHAEPLDTPASDDLELLALAAPRLLLRPGESERLTVLSRRAWTSSISAVSVVLTAPLASMTKHSCRAFADVALSRGTCS
jgi:hypothetical protein